MRVVFWLVVFAVVGTATQTVSRAQSADDLNEGSKVEWDATNEIWRLKWWGKSGHTYFIQQSDDLNEAWNYLPVIETGNDSVREWGLVTSGDRIFARLRHTDVATTDPANDDFDGDGLSNLRELLLGSDPFNPDSDGDGLGDLLELASGSNQTPSGEPLGSMGLFLYLGGER